MLTVFCAMTYRTPPIVWILSKIEVIFLKNVFLCGFLDAEDMEKRKYSPELIVLCYYAQTVSALGDYERTLVASLGDPEVASWIAVVIVKPQPPPATSPWDGGSTCPSVINGMHVRVLYSHVGTFDRPRATVLGVSVNYTASTTVAVNVDKRAGAPADHVPIWATVVFVDLTRPPVRTFAEPPTYEFRLPEDFYYPFWSSDNAKPTAANDGAGNGGSRRGSAGLGDPRYSPMGFSILLLVNLLNIPHALM